MVIKWRVYVGSCRQGHYHLIIHVNVIWDWKDIVYLVLLVLNNKVAVNDVLF